MRIVLVASSAPVSCPYCRDALGSETRKSCRKCGTLYHAECAQLAGSCGLIGCDGAFEEVKRAAAEDARLALIARPAAQATAAQLAAVARVIEATEWDARQRLSSPVPVVLGYFTRSALAHATAELEGAGISAFAIEAAALARRDRFLVHSAEKEGDALLLRSTTGETMRLPLGEGHLLVIARYATEVTQAHDMRPTGKLDDGSRMYGPHAFRRTTKATRHVRVIHVYRDERPIVFDDSVLADFRFLGPAMTGSATQNMTALGVLLGRGARTVDRTLERFGGGHMRHTPESGRRTQVLTNRAWIDAASLLVYHSSLADEPEKSEKGGP
jgi:hypothetical protein